jgi:mono/diheme cytochrome c family protein
MRTRRGILGAGALLLPVLLVGCGDDRPDTDRAATPGQVQQPATQPAAGAPQQPAQVTAGPLPAGVTQEMVEQGRQVFHGQGICFTCHGQNGAGTQLGPALNDGNWLWVTADGDRFAQMETVIRTGVQQPREYPAPMPAMGGVSLSNEQLRSVTAYVYSIDPSAGR